VSARRIPPVIDVDMLDNLALLTDRERARHPDSKGELLDTHGTVAVLQLMQQAV
jgi:hypothetical protein